MWGGSPHRGEGIPASYPNPTASAAYDALGRRLAKTVEGKTTIFWHDGARAIQEVDARPAVDAAAAASDGDLTNAALAPSKAGGIFAHVQLRVNFQPTSSPVPPGYVADKGRAFGTRTNGKSYGWSTDRTATARQRQVLAEPAPDSFVGMVGGAPATAASWSIAVPNGTYPVTIVAGDVASMESTNHLVVNGQTLSDPDPGGAGSEYEHGDLDGWVRTVTVTDGTITISAGVGAVLPKLVLVEIGQEGGSAGVAEEARLEERLNSWNEEIGVGQQIAVGEVRSYVHGSYEDELVMRRNGDNKLYAASNHLYSIAAIIDNVCSVIERCNYDAYGKRSVSNSGGMSIVATAIGQWGGFTGYREDTATGLYYARARIYSAQYGRFVSRDPFGYFDGMSMYNAYFIPNFLDPKGQNSISMSSNKEKCSIEVSMGLDIYFLGGEWKPNESFRKFYLKEIEKQLDTVWAKKHVLRPRQGTTWDPPVACPSCPDGIAVTLKLSVKEISKPDAKGGFVNVVNYPTGNNRADAHTWYMDSYKPPEETGQMVIAHEVGHLMGLQHPGGNSNEEWAYAADAESIMGRGNTVRPWNIRNIVLGELRKNFDDDKWQWGVNWNGASP